MLLVILACCLTGCTSDPQDEPLAAGGIADLNGLTLERTYKLDGEWLARPGADSTIFTEFAYNDRHWRAVVVESYFDEQGFPDEGLVWYRLHLRLPPDAPVLRGYLRGADNSYALYVSRPGHKPELIAASGHPALTKAETIPSRAPRVFTLPQDTSLVLSWCVANHHHVRGGPYHAIQIGPSEKLDRLLLGQVAAIFFRLGTYVLIGLFFLYYWRCDRTNYRPLSVGLISLNMALTTVFVSGILDNIVPSVMTFERRLALEGGTFLSLHALIPFMFWSFFPDLFARLNVGRWVMGPHVPVHPYMDTDISVSRSPWPEWLYRINTLFLLAGAAFGLFATLSAFILPPRPLSYVFIFSRWWVLVICPIGALISWEAVRTRKPLAGFFAFGCLFLLLSACHDALMVMGWLPVGMYWTMPSFVGFVLLQSYAIIKRTAYLTIRTRNSAVELRDQVDLRTRELQEATREAQRANNSKSEFLSWVSHELRTPLTSIRGFTQILEEELDDKLAPVQREFFSAVRNSTEKLLFIINDLLDASRLEAGKLELLKEPVSVNDVVNEVTLQFHPQILEKGLSCTRNLDRTDPYVLADPIRYRQVVINLMSNAVKYTDQGTITILVNTSETTSTITVCDTGSGISPDFLPVIFDRFTMESAGLKDYRKSSGLGLHITRELVQLMGGTISVTSEPGFGSSFSVTLPRVFVGSGVPSSTAPDVLNHEAHPDRPG